MEWVGVALIVTVGAYYIVERICEHKERMVKLEASKKEKNTGS